MKCKCKICGATLDTQTAYKVVKKTPSGKRTNIYCCSQEEYDADTELKAKASKLKDKIRHTLAYIFDVPEIMNTAVFKEWNEWNQIATNETILDYLDEHKEWLREKTIFIESSEYARIRYLSTILKNNLIDYQKNKESKSESSVASKIKPVTIEEYVAKYLDPNLSFNPNISIEDRIKAIINPSFEDDTLIAKAIVQLSYDEFLITPYWITITDYKRSEADFKCEKCGSSTNTCTHHKTYERHGYEHRLDVINNDLVVLCKECHCKEHNLNTTK